MILLVVAGCSEDGRTVRAPESPSPAQASNSGGQTGQSGTGLTCAERDPFEAWYAWDEVAELGFSGADAMAALQPFTGRATWADGAQADLAGEITVDPAYPEPSVVERAVAWGPDCARSLVLRGRVVLATEDGRLDAGFVINDVQIARLGGAQAGGVEDDGDGWLDPAFTGRIDWEVTADGATSSGLLTAPDHDGAVVGSW